MAEPRWLDPREQRAWRGLQDVSVQLRSRLHRQLVQDSGLSAADYEVLVHLSETPGDRLRVYELGDAMQWEKSRLSHQLTRMERRGLVAREECPTDARGAFAVLTPAGRTAIEAAAPGHVAEVRRLVVDVLTPAQLDALGEISEAILDRLGRLDNGVDDHWQGRPAVGAG